MNARGMHRMNPTNPILFLFYLERVNRRHSYKHIMHTMFKEDQTACFYVSVFSHGT